MLRKLLIVSIAAAGLAWAGPESGTGGTLSGFERAEPKAEAPGSSKGAEACREDIEKSCKGVEPGEGRLGACLTRKAGGGGLSASCERWAEHGGRSHRAEALRSEIDGAPPTAR